MIYLHSPSTDPYFNLALEQIVFDDFDARQSYFMLWQNDNTIVVGKNQNTAEEINAAFVKEKSINVVRRLSGGGAVYHDLGNLNFTFITDVKDCARLNLAFFCEPIVKTLKGLGIEDVQIDGRNDITIAGKKFSGNAQYIKRGRIMHHGTIMFDSDLSTVSKALNVLPDKIVSKGFKSVKSRITNILPHLKNKITLKEFENVLIENIFDKNDFKNYTLTDEDLKKVYILRDEKYATWQWVYGASPEYSVKKKRKFEGCGSIEVLMKVVGGKILDIHFYGDYFGIQDSADLAKILVNKDLNLQSLEQTLKHIDIDSYFHNLNKESFLALMLL
ncbi:MAG: lipoate--protein ligase [Elusimicrobiota bacterium]|jgi:lipoate-protein ligase A|nr:lipoate--protein ligase [Elusimicrobiota bacterium]